MFAQTCIVTGIVSDNGIPVETATVALLRTNDSSLVKAEITDNKGKYRFANIIAGEYIISASFVGFATALRKVTVKEGNNSGIDIGLQKQEGLLNEVSVTAKRPFIEMSTGKMVVNVEGSTITSGNALELLRRLPGVTVNPDNSILMNGKQGVQILINDRPTYLSGEQLSDYLRSMTADEVAQLELITQPGAKYDATGNSGIINFKMKRSRKKGFNGSAEIYAAEWVYPSASANMQLNYRNDKLSLRLAASDHEAKGFADWKETQHMLNPDGTTASTNEIHSAAWERFGTASVQMAADYNLTQRTTIGASVRDTYHPNTYLGNASATKTDNATGDMVLNDVINPDGFIRKDITTNAYISHQFSKDNKLDMNIDYLTYGNSARQAVNSHNYNAGNQLLPDSLILNSHQPTLINVYSVKADHSVKLRNGISLESGLKSSYVSTDNNAQFSIMQNGMWANDTSRTNHFVYRENINAAYLSASKDFGKKWQATAGMRGEQTMAEGVQYVHGSSFERNYFSLFPTAYVNYKADSNNQFELNYGRRIDRPPYHLLNPFIRYSFQYSYSVGNPYLLPQYTHNIELKHNYKNGLITTLGYSATTDIVNQMLEVDDNNRLYTIFRNAASCKMASCYIVYNKELWKWCSVNLSAFGAYVKYSGFANNQPASIEGFPYSFHFDVQADLGKGWKAATNGYFEHGTIPSLIQVYGSQLYTEFGISKKIGSNILVRVLTNDPFYVCRLYVHTQMDGFYSDAVFRNATRDVVIDFSYTFGKNQSGGERRSSLEEKGRIR